MRKSKYPPILLKGMALAVLSGAIFLACGAVWFICGGDAVLLILSLPIAVVSWLKAADLYLCASRRQYEAVEGICTCVSHRKLGGMRDVEIKTKDGQVVSLHIKGRSIFYTGRGYRIFLRQKDEYGSEFLGGEVLLNDNTY